MTHAIQPVIVTPDLDRLLRFYTSLLDAIEVSRFPQDGTPFYVALRVRDSELGLVADSDVETGTGQRMLLSVDVEDVDSVLTRVADAGGQVLGPPNDMPWGQRVAHITDPDGNTVNLTRPL